MSSVRQMIAVLYADGQSISQIARQIDVAPTTVSYHVARGFSSPSPGSAVSDSLEAAAAAQGGEQARAAVDTRQRVAEMLNDGMSHVEIARRLSITKATVSYHVRRLGGTVDGRCARRYDWHAIQRYYDEGHSMRECIERFGFSSASWFQAVKRGAIVPRAAATPIDELLVAGAYRGRFNLKARLIREGLKLNRCELCGLEEWRNRPITLALHHVNGVRNDNRLENLQLLCPNCHSQTENFAGRKGRAAPGTIDSDDALRWPDTAA